MCECEQKVSSVVSVLTSDIYLCEFNMLHSFHEQVQLVVVGIFRSHFSLFFVDTSAPRICSQPQSTHPQPLYNVENPRIRACRHNIRYATPRYTPYNVENHRLRCIFRAYMRTQHNVEKVKKKISPQHMCKEYIEYIMLRGCQIFSLYRGNLQTFCRLLT